MWYIHLAPRLDLTVSFHHEHFIVPISCPWVSEGELHEGLAACIAKTLGAIHSTKIPTGPTGKSGPPQWTRFFETFPVGPNWSIEFWTEIPGNFGSRGFARAPCQYWSGPVNGATNLLSFCRICRRVFRFLIGYILYGMGAWKNHLERKLLPPSWL